MQTGTYISGAGHLALIGWAFFGGVFNPEPLPFEVQEVAVISSAEFDAILAAQQPPGVGGEPAAITPPDTPVQEPELVPTPDPETERTPPEAAEATPPDETPVEAPVVVPPAEVTDTSPELTPPGSDVAVAVPIDERPQPRPVERVAPEAVAAPDPEAAPDEIEREAVTPEEGETESPQEPQEATAPEEAATEIVTEAEVPAGAPTRSIRPATRPTRVAAEVPPPAPQATADAVDDAVAAALADAAQSQVQRAPSGPPLSAGEKDSLRVAVSSCWNVGSLSTAALQTTVVVRVAVEEDGRPVSGSIDMLSFSGGTEAAARQAFEAARRAIIRCGARGFQLPAEKYDQWREIEMTFNPENMRIR
ncbi:MAG: energy transducer TonB [Aestuariivita sp.]|uniref:energy transducer TonB n=1 Tax=Aestuariivita sp. TaxID=1872407 RepID=UPI003BAEFCE5